MNLKFHMFLLLFPILYGCGNHGLEKEEVRPNILFIMGDDHCTQAISCYEGIFSEQAATVNIDRLASEGMRFTNTFCTNSICSPSRATILTGTYSHRNGLYILGQSFDTTQITSTRILHDQGYETAVFGKWHLRCTPPDFDEYMVLPVQGRYQDPLFHEKGRDELVTRKGWVDDLITDRTLEFLRERKNDKPFFVMCHFKSTHDPWASRPPYDSLFSHEEMPEPGNLFDTYESRTEPARRTTLKLEYMNQKTYPHHRLEGVDEMSQRAHIYQQYIRSFLRCGRVLDENVGRLLDYLEESGLDENTIVIYTADQGHFLGEHGFFSKRFMYEEAMRMPLIVRYPGHIEAGSVNEELVANIDFAPSILDLAGVEIPDRMQGASILPLLQGVTPDNWREAIYYRYWQHMLHREVTAHLGIRTKTHKLIWFHGQACGMTDYPAEAPSWELYDLVNDPAEMHNIYNDPDQAVPVARLKKQLLEIKDQYLDSDENYPQLVEVFNENYW